MRRRTAVWMLAALFVDALPLIAGELPLATLTPTPVRCVSDCNGNNLIAIDEVIRSVAISLDQQPLSACPRADGNGNGRVSVDELVQGVLNNLYGCGIRPPTSTPSATATITPILSATPTPIVTATAIATPTATTSRTPTLTRTATGTATPDNVSVCGGFISTTPLLCSVEVLPNPIPLFSAYRIGYCLSDADGDLRQACSAIRTSPQEPIPTCETIAAPGGRINGCFVSNLRQSTQPAGRYGLILYFEDRAGNRSNIVETAFSIR